MKKILIGALVACALMACGGGNAQTSGPLPYPNPGHQPDPKWIEKCESLGDDVALVVLSGTKYYNATAGFYDRAVMALAQSYDGQSPKEARRLTVLRCAGAAP